MIRKVKTIAAGVLRRKERWRRLPGSYAVIANVLTPLLIGFNSWVSPPNIAQQREIGAPIRRMFIYWDKVEPVQGQWNWSEFDQQYAAVLAAGLKPLIDVYDSPCWARPTAPCGDHLYTGPPDPAHEEDWVQFVTHVAQRYRSTIGIEVWNEENMIQNFYPQIDPVRYTRLLREAYGAVKAVDPTMPVISGGLGGLAGTGFDGAIWADQLFLDGMYAAGAGSAMDAIGIHVYPVLRSSAGQYQWSPAGLEPILNDVRAARAAAGAAQPIWVTEAGESTANQPGGATAISQTQQATDLLTMIAHVSLDADVGMFLIDTVDDAPLVASDPYNGFEQGLGAFNASGQPKPLACSLSWLARGSLRC